MLGGSQAGRPVVVNPHDGGKIPLCFQVEQPHDPELLPQKTQKLDGR
jgi:hypothetical protein